MKDPVPTYSYYVKEIIRRHPELAYLHATEPTLKDDFIAEATENDFIRDLWTAYGTNGRRLITAGGYTRETGLSIAQQKGDLIAYGRLFISNVSCLIGPWVDNKRSTFLFLPSLISRIGWKMVWKRIKAIEALIIIEQAPKDTRTIPSHRNSCRIIRRPEGRPRKIWLDYSGIGPRGNSVHII